MSLLRMLRSIAVIFVALAATLFISLAALFLVLVLRLPSRSCQGLARGWGRLILRVAGVRVVREGGEGLDPAASYIFASNHQSQFDILVLHGYLGHDFRWLAKKELFRVPVWGRAMRAAGYIPIDRTRGREALKSLAEAASRIAAGTSVVIFPEGTRSSDGHLREFKAGGMQLAIRSGVAIVPVAISGTHAVLPKGRLLARPGEVRIRVGDPVEVKSVGLRGKQELAERLRAIVADMLEEGSQSPHTGGG